MFTSTTSTCLVATRSPSSLTLSINRSPSIRSTGGDIAYRFKICLACEVARRNDQSFLSPSQHRSTKGSNRFDRDMFPMALTPIKAPNYKTS